MTTSHIERKIRQFRDAPLRPGDPRLWPKGTLLIIGGHEDKEGEKIILRELARLVAGGKLVIAPVASESPDEMWETYEGLMRGLGVRYVHHLRIEDREDRASVPPMKTLED